MAIQSQSLKKERSWKYTPSAEHMALIEKEKWREPNHPYILFVTKHVEILDAKKHEDINQQPNDYEGLRPYEALTVLRVEGCHKQPAKIKDRWLNLKGAKIVTWGKFPDANSPEAKLISDPGKMNPWEILETWLQKEVSDQAAVAAQVTAIQEKLAEALKAKEEAEMRLSAKQKREG